MVQGYDPYITDPRSCFFNKPLYDQIYFTSETQHNCHSSISLGINTEVENNQVSNYIQKMKNTYHACLIDQKEFALQYHGYVWCNVHHLAL